MLDPRLRRPREDNEVAGAADGDAARIPHALAERTHWTGPPGEIAVVDPKPARDGGTQAFSIPDLAGTSSAVLPIAPDMPPRTSYCPVRPWAISRSANAFDTST